MKQSVQQSTNRCLPARGRRFILTLILLLISSANFACLKRTRAPQQANEEQSTAALSSSPAQTLAQRVNINTASANELATLPGIGTGLAERIIAHREAYGPFRRPEHLIIVRGISDKKFRALRDLITVE